MNRHVIRVARRRRAELVRTWCAALLTALLFGVGLGAARAQEPFSTSVGIGNAGYPISAVPVQASSGNVAAATATATLPAGSPAQFTYITGFEFTYGGATAGSLVTCTVTNIKGGTLSYTVAPPTGAAVGGPPLIVAYNPALPSSAVATSIVVSCPTLGAGNTNATMVAHGFQQ